MSSFAAYQPAKTNPDTEIKHEFTDSISCLAFSGTADYLAATSWDNSVRIFEVNSAGQSQQRATYNHEGPVLSVCWSKDGTKIISGGADNAARMMDTTTGQAQQVAAHDAPVKAVRWVDSPQGGFLATGSWDKTIKYWDLRTSKAVATVQLSERVYSMDVQYPLLVAATADRQVHCIDIREPAKIHNSQPSPLKHQTRVVRCMRDGGGYSIGSIEGRAAIQYTSTRSPQENFTFRCHRDEVRVGTVLKSADVFSVNDMNWHPVRPSVFSTCGSDGSWSFWDKDRRQRLKQSEKVATSISASDWSRNGAFFVFAVSYDWGKGHSGVAAGAPNKIMLHPHKEEEISKKP